MDRNVYKFVVLSCVVVEHCAAWHSEPQFCEPHCLIPAYIWGIIGFLSSLLFIVILFLIYVIMKTKFYHNCALCNKHESPPATEKLEERSNETHTYVRKSVRRQNLDKSEPKTDNDNNVTLERQDSGVTTKSDYNTYAPRKPDSLDVGPRFMKNVIKDMPIILPEQMSQICREVLKHKTNKNEDSKGSLQNIDQLVKEGQQENKVELKYASTPELDIYDVFPTSAQQHETKNTNDQSDKNNSPDEKDNPKLRANTSRKNSDKSNPDLSCDIYDFPKEVNSNALEVCDIYDLPKTPSPTVHKKQKQADYIVAYFPAANVTDPFKNAEGKPNYALIQEFSKTKQSESVPGSEVENINLDEQYEVPTQILHPDQNNMYINANENFFMS